MVKVLLADNAIYLDAFLHQIFVDVDDAAAGEDVLKTVLQQLIVASAATDHNCLDIQVVKRGGHTVE